MVAMTLSEDTTNDWLPPGLVGPFGLEASGLIDGPAGVCPVCTGVIDQLALTLDAGGYEPASCAECGALLAA
jgi:hypothetical protein